MIRSMTGYGAAEADLGGHKLSIEIHSVNHRFAEISVRLPRSLSHFENSIRTLLGQTLGRGKITFNASWEGRDDGGRRVRIDVERARKYLDDLRRMKSALKLNGDFDMNMILALPDVVVSETESVGEDDTWVALEAIVRRAAVDHMSMREREGQALREELEKRLGLIETALTRIEEKAPVRPVEAKEKLVARLKPLLDGVEVDPGRLAQEVALLAERLDCTEECVRLRAHLAQFRSLLTDPEPAGRKLNFLLQEMNREVNTIGSKANDAEIGSIVIDLKDELEKVREQVQNVE